MVKSVLLAAMLACGGAFAAVVSDVRVVVLDEFGGDSSSVLARCQTKSGMAYDPVTVSRDVTSLKTSGEYEEISATSEDKADGRVDVGFTVRRKMRYQAPLVIKGNEEFGESKIADLAGLKDGYLYGEGDIAAAAAKIRLAYQRKYYHDAKVTPIATPIPGGGNSCEITFVIVEGERRKNVDFVFDGVESVEEDELRDAIGLYPWWNPVGWFVDEPVTPEELERCREKIAEVFRDKGYLDVKVFEPRLERTAENSAKMNVIFNVSEGPQYKIASTAIEGVTAYPVQVIAGKSELPAAGEVAGKKMLDDTAHRIAVMVGSGDKGLAETQVDVQWIPTEEDSTALDIVFKVTEGVAVVIDNILIEGNDYTKDKVIRREIKLESGNRMYVDRAEDAKKRLENLDYFSRVRYYLRDTGRGKDANGCEHRDLVYEVEEKNTGNFMVGVGASSVDSVFLMVELSQSNFDIFAPEKFFRGGGQKGRVYAQVGPRIQSYEASVTEPYFLDRHLELTVGAYRRQRWYDEYDIIRTGGDITLAYPVKFWPSQEEAFGRLGFRWTGEYIEFDDVEHGNYLYRGKTVSLDQEEKEYGDAFESVFRVFWSRDTRDSYFFPTEGSYTLLFADLAAGGDNEYWRLGFRHRSYFNVWKRYDHILMVALRGETIDGFDEDVPIYNRLFLGGPRSIRGIEYRHVSPHAKKLNRDGEVRGGTIPWGGQTLVCANLEYTIPIRKLLRIAGFTDIGSVSADEMDIADDFAWTVGIGFRIDIPRFPVRLDFATPIEKPSDADSEVFSFTVGYEF